MFEHFLRSLASCAAVWGLLQLLQRPKGKPRAE